MQSESAWNMQGTSPGGLTVHVKEVIFCKHTKIGVPWGFFIQESAGQDGFLSAFTHLPLSSSVALHFSVEQSEKWLVQ